MNHLNPDDDEPTGSITVDGELMPLWLPEGIDPDQLGLNWVMP